MSLKPAAPVQDRGMKTIMKLEELRPSSSVNVPALLSNFAGTGEMLYLIFLQHKQHSSCNHSTAD